MCRHVQYSVVHRGREAVVDLALRSAAGVAGIIHLFGEAEQVVEIVALFVVAYWLDYASGYGLRASSRLDPAIGTDGKRPTSIRVRMTCEWVPLNRIRRFIERARFSRHGGRKARREHSAANLHEGPAVTLLS